MLKEKINIEDIIGHEKKTNRGYKIEPSFYFEVKDLIKRKTGKPIGSFIYEKLLEFVKENQ
ncbi:MAG: hypothetical protein ABF289_18160 [Clostridiales bacterium]